jgi:hypothetical protein
LPKDQFSFFTSTRPMKTSSRLRPKRSCNSSATALVEGFLDLNRPTLVEGELDDQRIRASPSVQLDQMVTV